MLPRLNKLNAIYAYSLNSDDSRSIVRLCMEQLGRIVGTGLDARHRDQKTEACGLQNN
jgi:hypothetical protein